MEPLEILTRQSVHPALVKDVEAFRERHPVDEQAAGRVTCPAMPFYGKDILEMCWPKILPGFSDALLIIFLLM